MEHVGQALKAALAVGIPAALAAHIVATSNTSRLNTYFTGVATRFLHAHQQVRQKPTSASLKERARLKALLALVRARKDAIGIRRPTVVKCLAMLDTMQNPHRLRLAA